MTETWIVVRFQDPLSRRHEAYQKMRELGFERISQAATDLRGQEEFIPWREEFAEYTDAEIVGITLKETRRQANLTQRPLSQRTGTPPVAGGRNSRPSPFSVHPRTCHS